ncbi:MAG TPA: nucleotidyltransferase domain-containing protein [Chitinophagaceae bacterium]|nr:nucleotidyltransferase domain-containing protein [Chitinophagaceae bacterium]
MSTENIGGKLRKLREENRLPLRKVAALVDIDVAILSKMERGQRRLTKEVVQKLAKVYKHDEEELMVLYLSERIVHEIGDEDLALKAFQMAEEQVAYNAYKKTDRKAIKKTIKDYFKKDGRINRAWLFGSFVRGEDDYKSDIDVMIEVHKDSKFSLFDLADIKYQLEKLVPKKVDIVMNEALKPQIMEMIKPDLKIIYER